ncbi:helix-turn-helix domain-containing protein [Pseudoflavitalea sp. G-6-1-2]|uniref:helix-turn-helix domain-containing protein n=1 Tax=Pseudoflavitalea sp. G-6-1-2 TaxID=2728841 RepID=UPI00146C2D8F|nr:helix-turn-helix domain-containing protein [Pseudoflavitalea sp. G-6-1-2]NML23570.1 helix-turn-helix domain-containing protein [Pseudoflavitalea sp. G-6-1-2]
MTNGHQYRKAARNDVAQLLQMLTSIYPLSESLQQEFYDNVRTIRLQKDEVLLSQGQTCQHMYFIKTGAMMGYSVHHQKKITTYISIENEFVSSITGLHGVTPSKETVMAIESSVLLAMHNDVMQRLFNTYFDFNFIFRVMVEHYYRDAQERSYIIRIGNALERYMYFVQTKPGHIERLPEENVASLLNIKPLTLARLKKQYTSQIPGRMRSEEECEQIDHHIRSKQLFRNKKISLTVLSAELGISKHRLSSLINNHYHQSFSDYINVCRINCIKEQLSNADTLRKYTIEMLAHDAGFSSRSAFYNAFKKETGISPKEYLQQLNK